ncbi:hypothetical protein LIER_35955 [Lithospermum erythrorhizon]|uniref:Uncharacterized protein n=1 Tax=Lithospermum erythrorhizon TaxID=34254 RepID=A0AAV3P3E1_LITER
MIKFETIRNRSKIWWQIHSFRSQESSSSSFTDSGLIHHLHLPLQRDALGKATLVFLFQPPSPPFLPTLPTTNLAALAPPPPPPHPSFRTKLELKKKKASRSNISTIKGQRIKVNSRNPSNREGRKFSALCRSKSTGLAGFFHC